MLSRIKAFKRVNADCLRGVRPLTPDEPERKRIHEALRRASVGLYFETRETLAVDSVVELDLLMPGRASLFQVCGVVKYLEKGAADKSPGVGIHLVEVSAQPKEKLHVLPEIAGIAELLSGLLGKDIQIKKHTEWNFKPADTITALYMTKEKAPGALWLSDLNFASRCGAALAMIPEASVGDNLPGGKLGEALQENYREVVNVGASLFNSPKTPHLALKELYAHPDAFPDEVKSVLNNPSGRLDFKVELADYGTGRFTLLVL